VCMCLSMCVCGVSHVPLVQVNIPDRIVMPDDLGKRTWDVYMQGCLLYSAIVIPLQFCAFALRVLAVRRVVTVSQAMELRFHCWYQ
jgi:hypothetical protein